MTFFTNIGYAILTAGGWIYQAGSTTSSWIYPFYLLANPFYLVSEWLYRAGYYFFDVALWADSVARAIGKILDITTITGYFQTWINYATTAYNWIINAANIILLNIGAWWNTTQQTVLVWIENAKQWALAQVNSLAVTLAPVITGWNSLVSKIPSLNEILLWFTNWWANILSLLSSWWAERLLDIKALFNSWTLDLAPFWEGWQEIRDKVFDFFNDPLEWLWSRFTNWFLGAE